MQTDSGRLFDHKTGTEMTVHTEAWMRAERPAIENERPLRVLVVEDQPHDVELTTAALLKAGFSLSTTVVQAESEYVAALEGCPDIILCDHVLPQFSSVRALQLLKARGLDIPFIIVSGQIGEEIAVQAMQLGADDYVLKDRPARLGAAVAAALDRARLRRQARSAAEQLARSQERFRATFEQAAVGIAHASIDARFLMVNEKFCQMVGYTRDELLDMTNTQLLHPHERRAGIHNQRLLDNEEKTYSAERRYVRKDGRTIWINATVSLVRDSAGEPLYFLRVIEDITDRKRAQQRAALLQDTTRAISSAEDVAGALRTVLQTICESTRWNYGLAWTANSAGACLELRATWHDGSVGSEAFHRSQGTHSLVADAGIANAAFKSRRHRLIPDITQVEFRRRDSALSAGFAAWVGIPVIAGDKPVALLEFFIAASQMADADLVELVAVVGTQLGILFQSKAAQESLRESEEKFRRLTNNIPQVFWTTGADQTSLTYASAAFEKLTGLPSAECNRWFETVHEDDRERVAGEWSRLGEGGMYDVEFRTRHVNGTERWVRARAFPVKDSEGGIELFAGITEDITEHRDAQERLLHLAHYDHLTELPNRMLFYDRLKQALAQARRNARLAAVLFVDLDRFKSVNDLLGHAHGDKLLQQISKRLSLRLRSGDTVGRLGSDEFALMLTELATAEDAALVAQNILTALAEPFDVDGNETYITASIGIALYPSDGENVDALVRHAGTAKGSAKAAGRNAYRYYTAQMNERAVEKTDLEGRLRHALEREEFLLHFQPKVDLVTGDIAGFEALLRWQPSDGPLIAPARFIPLLEETGLIVAVGEWVLRAACAQLRAWKDAHVRLAPIAINLSARQLQQKDFCALVAKTLHEHNVSARYLELEITESAAMENAEASIAILQALKALGVHIAIDDFGTGYSSLSYLKRLPVDTVKIDRSFITDLATNPDDASLAQAIISMAHNLKLNVVAEGVETASQLSFLTSHGCDQIQGYYFSKPLPVAEATEMIRQNRQLQRPAADSDNGERTLLLLDDEKNVLASLKRLLRRDNYHILTATSAAAALEILANQKVGVIVSDQLMPGSMTGVEFLRRVKELYPASVRMVLSDHTDLDSITDAINKGAIYRFLIKPWEDGLLRAHIAEGFRRFAAVQQDERMRLETITRVDELTRANQRLQALIDQHCGALTMAMVEHSAS
jgi:diguanylate cyclase (GGDEF)-like protein/PAS domain S-box-containing protein